MLCGISYYWFKQNKYELHTLEYLTMYYNGTTYDMYELWVVARDNNIDTVDLEERLLAQILFAESGLLHAKSVFLSYYRSGGNRKLMKAFLSYYAYKYLIFDRVSDPEVFEVMKQEINYEDNEIALLAVLKYDSTLEHLPENEMKFIDYHLEVLCQKGILLPFYKNFQKSMRIPLTMMDKT